MKSLQQSPEGRRRARGFTITELVILIAILMVVGSIGFIRYGQALDTARVMKAKADLRTIAMEIDMFLVRTGALPETLADVGFGGRLDPWGAPYMYLNFERGTGSATEFVLANGLIDPAAFMMEPSAPSMPDDDGGDGDDPVDPADFDHVRRKDKFLFPLNSDYDLFSVGRNGKAWASLGADLSLDDVIRANDGDFFGLASQY